MLSHFSCVGLFATLWTIACQASLSMEFSRQEYRSGSSCFPPKDLQDPGIKLISLVSSELAGRFFTIVPAGKYTACMHAKSLQSCLCNSMDCSPPGSSLHGILQARILEWVAMPWLSTRIYCIAQGTLNSL